MVRIIIPRNISGTRKEYTWCKGYSAYFSEEKNPYKEKDRRYKVWYAGYRKAKENAEDSCR